MTLQKLRYIVAIVESGSVSAAAERLFISQPSLSAALREVEDEIGIELFSRTNKGITLSPAGSEFLGYARQVLEQEDMLESRFLGKKSSRRHFSVSTQHYAFAVSAFVNLIKKYDADEYEYIFRDTRTYEILDDVKTLKSEVGIIYINDFNEKVIKHQLHQSQLEFHGLFTARPHIFVSSKNPLAGKPSIRIEDLDEYPCLSFEQGDYNSFYYSEEILSVLPHKKKIWVSDRATIFNLMIGLNGYTVSTGIISPELNGKDIISIPLESDERITVGWIARKDLTLSKSAQEFIGELTAVTAGIAL
ncbi:MAG: LysR family transcriptional regulator [Clostridiales bacterium]|jgi:DNA-binding transcriptional LysR family regulator|nr:LysR family transcriptional regulator [Clostridiales bacterium]